MCAYMKELKRNKIKIPYSGLRPSASGELKILSPIIMLFLLLLGSWNLEEKINLNSHTQISEPTSLFVVYSDYE